MFLSLPALAWAPETRIRIADEAVRFMPPSLRVVLQTHREQLLRGLLGPMAHEDDAEHRPPWAAGSLDARLEIEVQALLELLDHEPRFSEVARQFGAAAHYVLDAGFPPGASDGDGAERYAHFAEFCESRRERFPLVFYGHDDPELVRGDFRGFALRVMRRARDEDRQLARAYARAAESPGPLGFDDRSVPFAVGSLSYSRSVTDVVRAWLAVWEQAHGDMGRTPYLQKKKQPQEAVETGPRRP